MASSKIKHSLDVRRLAPLHTYQVNKMHLLVQGAK